MVVRNTSKIIFAACLVFVKLQSAPGKLLWGSKFEGISCTAGTRYLTSLASGS